MNQKTIIFDCDGVLRKMVESLCVVYKEKYDTTSTVSPEQITDYDITLFFDALDWNENNVFKQYPKELFLDAEPYEDVVETLFELGKENTIIVVSKQYPEHEELTKQWLLKNNIYHDKLLFNSNRNQLRGDVFIDDKPNNIKMFLQTNPTATVFLRKQPYNSTASYPLITSLKELLSKK